MLILTEHEREVLEVLVDVIAKDFNRLKQKKLMMGDKNRAFEIQEIENELEEFYEKIILRNRGE